MANLMNNWTCSRPSIFLGAGDAFVLIRCTTTLWVNVQFWLEFLICSEPQWTKSCYFLPPFFSQNMHFPLIYSTFCSIVLALNPWSTFNHQLHADAVWWVLMPYQMKTVLAECFWHQFLCIFAFQDMNWPSLSFLDYYRLYPAKMFLWNLHMRRSIGVSTHPLCCMNMEIWVLCPMMMLGNHASSGEWRILR